MKKAMRWIGILAAVIALAMATDRSEMAFASGLSTDDVCIVMADQSDATRRIAVALKNKFPSAHIIGNINADMSKRKAGIFLTVGPSALRALLAKGWGGIVISLFTSSQAYRAILDNASKSRSVSVTAIYAEPSPFNQLHLIGELYRKPVSVAVLISDKTAYLQPLLTHTSAQQGISLFIEHVDADDKLNRVLNRIEHAAVILAIPDDTIYNAQNIRTVLMTAYRHNQSVIGFSTAFVKAGALASTYSDIDDITVQLADLLDDYAISGTLPEPQFPKYFSVAINDDVARSFNVVIDDAVRKFTRKPRERKQ